MSLSDSPWLVDPSESGVKKGCPNNPLHMGWGGGRKAFKNSERFQEEQGSEADPMTLLTTKNNFQKNPKICVVFF